MTDGLRTTDAWTHRRGHGVATGGRSGGASSATGGAAGSAASACDVCASAAACCQAVGGGPLCTFSADTCLQMSGDGRAAYIRTCANLMNTANSVNPLVAACAWTAQ